MNHDVAVAWNWEHDEAFIADLERACRDRGLTFRSVTPATVEADLAAATAGEARWGVLLDRAWESDPRFLRLNDVIATTATRILNRPELSARMGNKAAAHALFSTKGIPLPRLVDFMPREWSDFELARATEGWGRPLWLKPACAGGGDGVMPLDAIPPLFPQTAEWLEERFVLQENAAPMTIAGRPAWFRVFHVMGTFHSFWWHPKTHAFATVTAQETAEHGLDRLTRVAESVAHVAGLDLFSCEIALTAPGEALLVDPVNDPVDFRRQSRAADAIPDAALASMIDALAAGIAAILRGPQPFAGSPSSRTTP